LKLKISVAGLFFLFIFSAGYSQLTVVEGSALGMTPQQLVQNWLVGQGITISNVTYNGSTGLITSNQIGTFTAEGTAFSELQLEAGLVMTSGSAGNTIGPNNTCSKTTATGSGGDPDLTIIANSNTNDKAVIEFDFIPESDTIKFNYVFGSEEIWQFCYSYNDAFGFFLSGPGISGTFSNNSVNIALMPGTANWVTLNNMCDDIASTWCNKPVSCPSGGNPPSYANCNEPIGGGQNLQYNGLTFVFTAWHVVIPCSTYHIKLAVGDALDQSLDSGVFLEKNSFTAAGLSIQNTFTLPALGNHAIEGCSNATVSFTFPDPVPAPYTLNFTIGGTAINGTDYFTIPNFVIFPTGSDSVALVIQPFFDGIPEGIETVILGFTQISCFGSQTTFDTIQIYDNALLGVSAGPDDTICVGDTATLTALGTGGQMPYSYSWNVPGGNARIVKVSPGVGAHMYVQSLSDGCGSLARDTMYLLVKPRPSLTNNPFTSTICSEQNTNLTLQSTLANTQFSWTSQNSSGNITGHSAGSGPVISQILINTGWITDSVLYTITPMTDGCPGNDSTYTVRVRPEPDVLFTPAQSSICSGENTNIGLASHVAGSSFSWTATGNAPTVSGFSNGTGNSIIQTLFTTAYIPDTVVYHVTATANGCPGEIFDHIVIVNPVTEVTTNPMSDTICSGNFTEILLTATCAGSFFTWTASPGIGNISGFSNGSGDTIIQQLFDPDPLPGSILYTITPSTGSCVGNDTLFTLWVKPTPHLTNTPSGDSVCNNTTLSLILTSDVAGTTFTWTATGSSLLVTGYSNSSLPGVLIDQTLVNSGYIPETVTYHILPYFSGCYGPVTDYTVLVYPTPDLSNFPTAKDQCNQLPVDINLTSNVAGTAFTWRASAGSPDLSGYHSNTGPGTTFISDTLVNSGFVPATVTYRILPMANGCTGDSTDYTVTVFPTPDLSNASLTQSQCNNQNTNITLLSNVTGTLFTWTASASSSFVSGFSSGSGTAINHILINTGFSVDTVTYTIIPHANGCDGENYLYRVIVFPVSDLAVIPPSQEICSGKSTAISLQSNVAGTIFSWTATGSSPNVTGYAPGSANSILQILVNSGYMMPTVTYSIQTEANGCTGASGQVTVTVNPLPVVSFTPCFDTITMTNAKPIFLKGGIPLGGAYSGNGVTGREFNPGVAGPGVHSIRYSYTNNFGCVDSSSLSVFNFQFSIFNCGDILTDLRDNKTYPTVQIGTQCWMSANLNYGVEIPYTQYQLDNCIPERYRNPTSSIQHPASVYQWDELMAYTEDPGLQGLCPPGWHIPTESEWNQLFTFYISSGFAGNPLKSSGYSGFNALLEGIRFHNMVWKFSDNDPVLRSTLFWSSTVHGKQKAWAHGMNEVVINVEYTPSVSLYPALRSNAFAVRCIRD
jgi:uncharacterized protein (TIGR02145 family)